MNIEAHTCNGDSSTVTVALIAPRYTKKPQIELCVPNFPTYLDENHAQALVLALQAAIAEVQARSIGP